MLRVEPFHPRLRLLLADYARNIGLGTLRPFYPRKLSKREKWLMAPAIEFRNLSVKTSQGRLLLDDVSLPLEDGSVTAILGRSGSGKTTLLRTVNRMVELSSGEVRVRGANVQDAGLIALRRGIGYVIQETGLFPHFTVERNVGLVLEIEGRPREERIRRSQRPAGRSGTRPLRICAPLSASALRRPAPARGAGPGPGRRSADPPHGRALRRPRSSHPGRDAGYAADASRARFRRPCCSSPTISTKLFTSATASFCSAKDA